MVMFAKGGALVYDVATDQWIEGCCEGEGGGAAGNSPVWIGSSVLLVGSFDEDTGGDLFTPTPAPTGAAPVPCAERTDRDLDVANEPGPRQFGVYRESTRDGCLVRIDVLADRPGPDHCEYQSRRVIITGSPWAPGTRTTATTSSTSATRATCSG